MEDSKPSQELLPTVFVILGATGDLMQKKLAPALFRLHQAKLLPELFQVVGFARQGLYHEAFQSLVFEMLKKKVQASDEEIKNFCQFFVYQQGFFEEKEGYEKLAYLLGQRDNEWKVCSNKLFHLAVPPQYNKTIFKNLADSGLTKPCSPQEGWTRVIVEKPFRKDFETVRQ